MSLLITGFALGIPAAALLWAVALGGAAALGDDIFVYDDEADIDDIAPVISKTGEPIINHDQWAVTVVPEREPVA